MTARAPGAGEGNQERARAYLMSENSMWDTEDLDTLTALLSEAEARGAASQREKDAKIADVADKCECVDAFDADDTGYICLRCAIAATIREGR